MKTAYVLVILVCSIYGVAYANKESQWERYVEHRLSILEFMVSTAHDPQYDQETIQDTLQDALKHTKDIYALLKKYSHFKRAQEFSARLDLIWDEIQKLIKKRVSMSDEASNFQYDHQPTQQPA